MAKRRIAILLILHIGVSPVASAFTHCPGFSVVEIDCLSLGWNAESDPVAYPFKPSTPAEAGHHAHPDTGCDASGSCVVHLCAGLGLIPSAVIFFSFDAEHLHSSSFKHVMESTQPPEIKPPIQALGQRVSLA